MYEKNAHPHLARLTLGQPDAKAILREYTQMLIETAPAPEAHDELITRGERLIAP